MNLHVELLGALLSSMNAGRSPHGRQVRAFVGPESRERFLRIAGESRRSPRQMVRYLVDLARDDGTAQSLPPGARVEGHQDGVTLPLKIRMHERPYRNLQALARELRVYQGSVSHLMGLCVEAEFEKKTDAEWIDFFWRGQDIVERIYPYFVEFVEEEERRERAKELEQERARQRLADLARLPEPLDWWNPEQFDAAPPALVNWVDAGCAAAGGPKGHPEAPGAR